MYTTENFDTTKFHAITREQIKPRVIPRFLQALKTCLYLYLLMYFQRKTPRQENGDVCLAVCRHNPRLPLQFLAPPSPLCVGDKRPSREHNGTNKGTFLTPLHLHAGPFLLQSERPKAKQSALCLRLSPNICGRADMGVCNRTLSSACRFQVLS